MDAEKLSVFAQLKVWLDTAALAGLGPQSRPGTKPAPEIESHVDLILRGTKLPHLTQLLIRGLLWLWHDHLDEAHTVAQAIENPDGSLLHAIMHRREPDYGNAKYWFRRAGQHSCYPSIAAMARPHLESHARLGARLIPGERWDPNAFVDACESAAAGRGEHIDRELLQRIQKIEAEAFLKHLTREAPG